MCLQPIPGEKSGGVGVAGLIRKTETNFIRNGQVNNIRICLSYIYIEIRHFWGEFCYDNKC